MDRIQEEILTNVGQLLLRFELKDRSLRSVDQF